MYLRFLATVGFLTRARRACARATGRGRGTVAGRAGSAPPARVVAGQDGIAIESGNGEYRLQIGLLLQADGRFAANDDTRRFTDTFAIRRLRPYLRGRILRRFEFYLNPDFAGGTLVVQDAYFDTIFSPAFRIRSGKGKTPFGMERLHSASNLLFMDRALPTALAPNRDLGMQVLGDVHGRRRQLSGWRDERRGRRRQRGPRHATMARTCPRASSSVRSSRNVASPLRGLGIAVSGNTGRQAGAAALPSFRTQTLQQPYFSYATGAAASGRRNPLFTAAVLLQRTVRRLGRVRAHRGARHPRQASPRTSRTQAWQVAASWVLTGEAATDAGAGVRPRAIFDPSTGHWGAFQVAARVHELEVDQRAIDLGFAAAGSSRKAQAWTVGLNWYLTGNVKYVLNFERTVFDDNRAGARRAGKRHRVSHAVEFLG